MNKGDRAHRGGVGRANKGHRGRGQGTEGDKGMRGGEKGTQEEEGSQVSQGRNEKWRGYTYKYKSYNPSNQRTS